jgi:hypothetical protein
VASIADVYVTVLPETSKVADGIRRAFKEVDKDAREAGARWKKEIDEGLKDIQVKVDADTSKARAEIDAMSHDKDVKVKVSVDRSELDRLTSVGGAGGAGGSAGGLLGGIGLQPLAIAAAIPLVSSLSGVLGLLPAAAGGAAGAIGTLMVAMHGFTDAIGDINDPKKFAEDLTQISPAAQSAAQAIQGLMPQVKTLMMTVQDAFFKGIGGQIQALGTTYLPMFQTFIGQMAGTMNRAMTGLSQLFQTPQMIGNVQTIVNNLSTAFNNWSRSLGPIVKAFTEIGVVGSQFLPALGTAAAQAATQFSKFISQMNQSGQLGAWIQTGIQAFGQLQNIMQTIVKAFMDMAPAGLPVLNLLSSTLATIEPLIGPLATQFGNWVTAMTPLVNMVAQLATSLMPLFIQAMQNLNQTITGTVGVLTTVVGWLGKLGDVLNGVAHSLFDVVGQKSNVDNFFHGMAQAAQEALNPLQMVYDIYKAIKDLTAGNSVDLQAHQKLNDAVAAARNVPPSGAGTLSGGGIGFGGGGGLGTGLTTPTGPVDGWTGKLSQNAPIAPVSTYVAPPLPTSSGGGGGRSAAPAVNLPYTGTADPNAGIATSGAVASNVYTGGTTSDTHGLLVPNAANLKQIIQQQFGITDIGGYRAPDGYNEHSSGQALDIMVGANKQLGDQVNQFLLKNAAALGIQYDLWQQTQWNPDGTTSGMSDRGSPTANHRDHVHARVRPGSPASGALSSPVSSMYPSTTSGSGLTSSDMSLRNAQERVNDTQHSEEQAQARMDELNAKGTATAKEREAAEYALAKAKREHKDAVDSLTIATDKYNKSSATTGQKGKGGMNSDAQSLGSSFLSGIAQIFGLDGSVFADPTQFGLFNIFKSAMGLKFDPSQAAPGMGQPAGGGVAPAGGDFLQGILSSVPQPFGQPVVGSPNSPGPGNAGGPGGMDFRGATFGVNPQQWTEQIAGLQSSNNRYQPMLQNLPTP